MARWRKGEEGVAHLIEQRHLQRVVADPEIAALCSLQPADTSKALVGRSAMTRKPPTALPMMPRVRAQQRYWRIRGFVPQLQAGTSPSLMSYALSSPGCLAWLRWTGFAGAVIRQSTPTRGATIRSLRLRRKKGSNPR